MFIYLLKSRATDTQNNKCELFLSILYDERICTSQDLLLRVAMKIFVLVFFCLFFDKRISVDSLCERRVYIMTVAVW